MLELCHYPSMLNAIREFDDWWADVVGCDLFLLVLLSAGFGAFASLVLSSSGC